MKFGDTLAIGGVSIQGGLHLKSGTVCQDAIQYITAPNYGVLAVADGHGSKRSPRSDRGSSFAVSAALEVLEPYAALISESKNPSVESFFHQYSCEELLCYGSTLLAAITTERLWVNFQLGDGDQVIVWPEGRVERVFLPDKMLLGGETTSLCQSNAWRYMQMRIFEVPLPKFLMISTDGYVNSFRSESDYLKAASDYFTLFGGTGPNDIFAALPDWLESTSSEGSGDDITVGLLYVND